MPPSCPVSSRDHDTASRCSELHLPGASHRTCAVGLVGGCLGAPWDREAQMVPHCFLSEHICVPLRAFTLAAMCFSVWVLLVIGACPMAK